jgi:fructose-1,6-bisphosphatase-3
MSPESTDDGERTALRALRRQFPSIDAAVAEIARLSAACTLPLGSIHVLSDIHGADVKLRHVINNASGTLRPLIEQVFAGRLTPGQMKEFLTLVFYPRETLEHRGPSLVGIEAQRAFCRPALHHLFELMRLLARRHTHERVEQVCPAEYRDLFRELLHDPASSYGPAYYDALVDSLVTYGRALQVTHLTVRAVRNLAIDELIIAGDCWDRGPRGDRVVQYLQQQPSLSFVWGNHDAAWLGACLGQEALIAQVLRISCRYRRLAQLEEGYGIFLAPLEKLARDVYRDDPATCYMPRGEGIRETVTVARMQKAAAVMQFKLEGQTIARNPQWGLDGRRLLRCMNLAAGSVVVDGRTFALRDSFFPTFDADRPEELSAAERACMDRLHESFLASQKLWEQMKFLVEHGSMYLVRDDHLIFHGCVPVDERGEFLPLEVDGIAHRGRELFDALDRVLARSLESATEKDRDLMWYLWCGPRSPLFGKDRIATFEKDLIDDPATQVEKKNPYFPMIHEAPFCDRILIEFGADPARGLIVNGHVPVKIETGESPLKRSGKAITIDGAFSETYGDHGYTLLLEPDRTLLAKHHHFESVEAAVREGVDIVPEVSVVREWQPPRRVADTERGREMRRAIAWLERLVQAYRTNQLRPR